jgi:pimeloyl-ACP methyl ester carboxylesterase
VFVVLGVIVVLVAGFLTAAWVGQRRLIYFPDRGSPSVPAGVAEVDLATADGLTLTAWLLPPAGSDTRTAVLVASGNAGNRRDRLPLASALADLGLTVLLLDYRGYGGNPGHPTEEGLAHDARAGLEHLTEAGFTRIVYFGESLGAGVVAGLATEHAPAGLVLRSPFVDLAAVAGHHYPVLPVRLLLRDRYPVADAVGRVRAPTVVIYGDADSTVPPEQSRTVADRAAGPVTVVVVGGADHNDLELSHGPAVIGAVRDLVRDLN